MPSITICLSPQRIRKLRPGRRSAALAAYISIDDGQEKTAACHPLGTMIDSRKTTEDHPMFPPNSPAPEDALIPSSG
jgi:hypothetical protein